MSLLHVHRAEKLGRATELDETTIEKVTKSSLADVHADSGCNMLLVFLLSRWGDVFSGGGPRLRETEDLQNAAIDAYLGAGCLADEKVATRKFYDHASPSLRYTTELSGKLSALGFVGHLASLPEMAGSPDLGEQLERLRAKLKA